MRLQGPEGLIVTDWGRVEGVVGQRDVMEMKTKMSPVRTVPCREKS